MKSVLEFLKLDFTKIIPLLKGILKWLMLLIVFNILSYQILETFPSLIRLYPLESLVPLSQVQIVYSLIGSLALSLIYIYFEGKYLNIHNRRKEFKREKEHLNYLMDRLNYIGEEESDILKSYVYLKRRTLTLNLAHHTVRNLTQVGFIITRQNFTLASYGSASRSASFGTYTLPMYHPVHMGELIYHHLVSQEFDSKEEVEKRLDRLIRNKVLLLEDEYSYYYKTQP